jgi:tetratricopeptide (TPR) repeat protein/predicted Ser/Thr protein kinase
MPASSDLFRSSASGEPTLAVTPPGATPAARIAVDPNAPTIVPAVAPDGPTRRAGARPPRGEDLPPPQKIGRFTVLRELGRGGTGVVYAAYDEQLDRKVAVKLLHSETREDLARNRLLREAQAMARLSHPNIVGVHEVGTFGAQIYVAMEFVHGMTLHAWLKRQRRSFTAIAEMFRQAGEGLAAAHEAGLVHRDFKPANVMVGDDGRVRVLDFGLARAEAEPGAAPGLDDLEPAAPHTSAVANLRSLDASITVTGVMLGTPAYMSPEQFLGVHVDARSDQFAFCVSLFEAAYRERPFSGDTLAELMSAVLAGLVRDVPTPAGVPRSLRPLLLRGLRRQSVDRFPSMRPLLAELARFARPQARRGWFAAAGLAAAVAGGGVGLAYETGLMDQACTGGDERIAAVWHGDTNARLAAAARASGLPQAEAAYARAAEAFDAYADDWLVAYADACTARAELLDLRMACLDERRQALAAAVDMFEKPDEQLLARTDELVHGLPKISACADETWLRAAVRPPDDPEVAERVQALRGELARAETHETGGRFADAIAILDDAVAAAPASYLPLRAELELRRGSVRENQGRYLDARKALEDAFFAAVESGHLAVAVDAATRLAYITGRRLQDKFASHDWLEHAEIYGERTRDPLRLARALTVRGALANHHDEPAVAREALTRALRLLHEAGAEETVDHARTLRFYGDYLCGRRESEDAVATEKYALALMTRLLGPQHPDTAMLQNSLGIALQKAGEWEQARVVLQDALDSAVDLPNQRNHIYMTVWINLAGSLEKLGRVEDSIAAELAGIEVLERSSEGRLTPELSHLRAARIGMLLKSGRPEEAEAELLALLARAEQTWGADALELAWPLLQLSSLHLYRKDAAQAAAVAERALALVPRDKNPSMHHQAKSQLALALADSDPARARDLAREFRDFLLDGNAEQQGLIKVVDHFLTKLAERGYR